MIKSQDSERNAKQSLTERTTDDDDNSNIDQHEADGDNEEHNVMTNNDSRSHRSQMMCKTDAENLQYEDPMVSELKQTEVQYFS